MYIIVRIVRIVCHVFVWFLIVFLRLLQIFYSDSNDTDYKSCSGNESDTRRNALKQNGSNPRSTTQEKDQNFEIPNDLLGEFQALKKATNLDTTSLMRKLIHDYAQ